MNATQETLPFQADVQELLGLVVHSLYKRREIFLRELVSNASDALDKLRIEALEDATLGNVDAGEIRIAIDRAARTLTVEDDGIGMTHDELVQNLGTIARSGTRAFLERLKAAGGTSPELIGQFGVGFYSSFLVADEVVVETRRAGDDQAWRWRSRGEGRYTVEPCERTRHGTSVILHLKSKKDDEDEDPAQFLEESRISDTVKRWSDFVAWPIRMDTQGDDGKTHVETLNSMRPLWTRAKDDVKRAEYDELYRRLTRDWEAPAEVVHFKAEGVTEYTALLFVPSSRPMDLYDGTQGRSRIALYVKRVLIMPDCQDLLPTWLRFVRGLVDAPDLPLNVSREVLQSNPVVRQIERRLVQRMLQSFAGLLVDERQRWAKIWADFGAILKEGIWLGADDENRISRIALWSTTHDSKTTTLAEYVARMKPDQKAIWCLTGDDPKTLASSPHLEAFTKRGEEVLFLVDPIDEWVLQRLTMFDGKPLRAIDGAGLDLESASEKEARETLERDSRDLLSALEERLGEHVKSVRFSTRLSDSPALFVREQGALSAHMARVLRAANQAVPNEKRVLELNPDHALTKKLALLQREEPRGERFADLADVLLGQALLAEGSPLVDPARFAKLVAKMAANA